MLPVSANRAAPRATAIRTFARTLHTETTTTETAASESDTGLASRRYIWKPERGGWRRVLKNGKHVWRSQNVFISRSNKEDTDEVKDATTDGSLETPEDVWEAWQRGALHANTLEL
jgi:hypothetical protein